MSLAGAAPFAVAAWALDEASGTRVDQVGANDLTDNNTVGAAAGKFGNAADFEAANSESLTRAETADLTFGDVKFTLRAWVQLESKAAQGTIAAKWRSSGGSQREYLLIYSAAADRFQFLVSPTGTGSASVSADNFGSPSLATWYLIHAWHDPVADQIGIAVNAGTANTAAHSTGVANTLGADFGIGARPNPTPTEFFDGLIDDVVLLDGYVLDATERTEDYNSGAGVAFADWAGGGGFIDRTSPILRHILAGAA